MAPLGRPAIGRMKAKSNHSCNADRENRAVILPGYRVSALRVRAYLYISEGCSWIYDV